MSNRRRVRTVSSAWAHRRGGPGGGHEDHETYAVVLPTGSSRSAERWARATFDGAPAVVRLLLVAGWRGVLRLRPTPAEGGVLGWRLDHVDHVDHLGDVDDGRGSGDDRVVLSTRSATIRATLTFAVRGDELVVTGRRELDGMTARVLWAVVRPVHRLVAPQLVNAAVRRSTPPSVEPRGTSASAPVGRGRAAGRTG